MNEVGKNVRAAKPHCMTVDKMKLDIGVSFQRR
jgi:hypothetical protein